jgi:hypothetical protein
MLATLTTTLILILIGKTIGMTIAQMAVIAFAATGLTVTAFLHRSDRQGW